jgi:hypothetical protein
VLCAQQSTVDYKGLVCGSGGVSNELQRGAASMASHLGNNERLENTVGWEGKAVVLEQDQLQTCLCSVVGVSS